MTGADFPSGVSADRTGVDRTGVDWSDFVFVAAPYRSTQSGTMLHPAFAINFYLHRPDCAAVVSFFEDCLPMIRSGLTHYHADGLRGPARITQRALDLIPTWMNGYRPLHRYRWRAFGGADPGVTPPGFELELMQLPPLDSRAKRQAVANALSSQGAGPQHGHFETSTVRVVLPVDHPLACRSTLVSWLRERELVRSGAFMFADAGYSLESMAPMFGGTAQAREREITARHPGFDVFRSRDSRRMLLADHDRDDFVPMIKRAAWTSVLSPVTAEYLGGAERLRHELHADPAISIDAFEVETGPPSEAVIICAGERPELGDVERGELLPLQQRVAALLRPLTVRPDRNDSPFWHHLFAGDE